MKTSYKRGIKMKYCWCNLCGKYEENHDDKECPEPDWEYS
ncbi:unnamed protein product [marine sediment metagenome]|uniref:Uncharacterized protein n=1 Tax=marine sediment metagenome TaxID=412755 RepID=X1CCD0_9ZZZZ